MLWLLSFHDDADDDRARLNLLCLGLERTWQGFVFIASHSTPMAAASPESTSCVIIEVTVNRNQGKKKRHQAIRLFVTSVCAAPMPAFPKERTQLPVNFLRRTNKRKE